jgi:hypothetical protein
LRGDELRYVDESGNAKQGKVERRIFNFATPVSTSQWNAGPFLYQLR